MTQPSQEKKNNDFASWSIHGPMFRDHAYKGQGGLGISYTTGIDTRWYGVMTPGIKMTDLDLSGTGGTRANVNRLAVQEDANARLYAYVNCGTDVAKIALDDMLLYDPGVSCSARVTDVLATKNGSGTKEVSLFQEGSSHPYDVITTVNAMNNLVTNGEFETNITGWTALNSTVTQSATQAKFGDYSMKVVTVGAAYDGVSWQTLSWTNTHTLRLSFWAYGTSGSKIRAAIFRTGSVNQTNTGDENGYTLPYTGWHHFDFSATAGSTVAGDGQIYIDVGQNAQAITFYVDRVIFTSEANYTDTASENDDAQVIRIAGLAGLLVAGFNGQVAYSNDISGSGTMDSPTWVTRATYNGSQVTPTGFTTDGITWVWMTSEGPLLLNPTINTFERKFDSQSKRDGNGRGVRTMASVDTLIPMERSTLHLKEGNITIHAGPEAFEQNVGPILGHAEAFDFDGDWGLWSQHNAVDGYTYLLAFRPTQPEDGHDELFSFYCIGRFTEHCELVRYLGTQGSRDLGLWVIGKDDDVSWLEGGRTQRWIDDSRYQFIEDTEQEAHLTEFRVHAGQEIVPIALYLDVQGVAVGGSYVDIYLSVNGATETKVARVDTNGPKRIPLNGQLYRGWRIRPILKMYNSSSTSGYPYVIDMLTMEYVVADGRGTTWR